MSKKTIVLFCLMFPVGWAGTALAELLAYYTFDEASDPTVDSSGMENHGAFDGVPIWGPGYFGQGLAFDGSLAIEIPASTMGLRSDSGAVAFWLRMEAAVGINTLWWGGDNNTGGGFGPENEMHIHTESSGQFWGGGELSFAGQNTTGRFHIFSDPNKGNAAATAPVSPILMGDGTWRHVACTWGNDDGNVKMYLNGKLLHESAQGVSSYGLSTMYLGQMANGQRTFTGTLDDVAIYDTALSPDEVVQIMNGGILTDGATHEDPADGATDVLRDVILSWTPVPSAVQRDVYFGTVFEDVNDAATDNPLGILVSQGQEGTTLDPGRLEFDQTYYWRVDEVNAAPDFTVFKGGIWRFTVEPIALPIGIVSATASSSFGTSVAENTINGSGLTDDLHGTTVGDMWISGGIPATIEYAFDRAYKLHELWVWNSNQTIEPFIGFGAKDVVIEHSLDGADWTVLEGVGPFAQAGGAEGSAANSMIDFGGAVAQHVRMTINSVHGFAPQASLSEVRFYAIPTTATRPYPASGATGLAPDTALSWGRKGREAEHHEVYIGTDATDLPLAGSTGEMSFSTEASDLQLGQTYHWQVVEVNDAMDPSQWAGPIWSFATVGSIVVDGMESYKDEEFFEIWATWIDGFEDPAKNGALVGANPTSADFSPETGIVHGGSQSLPIHYDNSAAAQSEATRSFETSQDWTAHGVKSLVLYFHGSGTNTGGTFYLKINDTKVAYDGDTASLMRSAWNKWVILLDDLAGVDLSSVRSLTLGVEGGGAGVVYVDDITLTPVGERDLILPTEPGGGLVLHLPFDGDYQDVSGNGLHGTPMGGINPPFEAGPMGQAVIFDGVDQYVEITGYKGILGPNPFSITAWIKTSGNGTMVGWGSTAGGVTRVEFRIDQNRLRCESSGNVQGDTTLPGNEWVHVAVTIQENAVIDDPDVTLYLNGLVDNRPSTGATNPLEMAAGFDVTIGRRHSGAQRWFPGSLDEVRLYNRALSAAEVAYLAGRTVAFERP